MPFSTIRAEHFRDDLSDAEAALLFSATVKQITIEVFSYCNRTCWFCPNSLVDRRSENKLLPTDTYSSLIGQLASIDYGEKLAFSRYNEPLADKVILQRIAEASKALPRAHIFINTNGDYLTRQYMDELRDAGLNELIVQAYLGNQERYSRDNIAAKIKTMVQKLGLPSELRVDQPDWIEHAIAYEGMNVRLYGRDFATNGTSRGGSLPVNPQPRTSPCFYPFSAFYVDYNGNCVPCCNLRSDVQPESVVGNIHDQPDIFRIFAGSRLIAWRRSLISFSRKAAPCHDCTFHCIPETPGNRATSDHWCRVINDEPCELLDPAQLFSPLRLDLCVKFLYARAILDNRREDLFERLYIRHILMRTGGSEPEDGITRRPSDKRSVADHLRAFRELIHGIRDNGYDAAQPVPVMDNGRIGNGAHRLAACRALGVPVAVSRHSGDCGTWDFDWFARKGFALPDLQRILHCWVTLDDRAIVVVLWPSVRMLWRQLTELCREKLTLVGAVTLDCQTMGRPAFDSLILDLYANENPDHAEGLRNIERKCDLLANYPAEVQVLVMTPGPHTSADFSMTELKAQMRGYADAVAATEDFITCHASASPAEARHMADTLLCPEYVEATALRRRRKPRPEFLAWLNGYDRCLSEQKLDHSDCCVVGSSPLEVADIRLSTDIDFALREEIRDGRYPLGPVTLGQDVDIVSRGYHRSNRRPWISDAELAANPDWHFRFRGRSFAGIDIVHDRKDFSRRPKDCADVARIDALCPDPVYGTWLREQVDVDGRRGGNFAQFAIDGWSKTESWGTWSDGETASLLLPAPRLAFDHIALQARMVAVAPEGMEQEVQVAVNSMLAGNWRIEQGAVIARCLHIPAAAIGGKARFRLDFRIASPHSPGQDKRRLGIGLITLALKAVRTPKLNDSPPPL